MFEPTIPFGEPELMRASAYRLYLQELDEEAAKSGVSSRIASLSPSLRADLYRFEADGGTSEVLEVVAACVRHAKRVAIHLQSGEHVVPLTVFPEERLVHCPLAMVQLLAKPLTELRVLHVEPALLRPPGDEERGLIGEVGRGVAWNSAPGASSQPSSSMVRASRSVSTPTSTQPNSPRGGAAKVQPWLSASFTERARAASSLATTRSA